MTEDEQLYNEFITLTNFIKEMQQSTIIRWKIINQFDLKNAEGIIDEQLYVQLYHEEMKLVPLQTYINKEQFLNNIHMIINAHKARNLSIGEDFEFFTKLNMDIANPARLCTEPGIRLVNLKYHENMPVFATEQMPETGFEIHPIILRFIKHNYPQYIKIIEEYCRPLGTTDATFKDFNKQQRYSDDVKPERNKQVLELIKEFMNVLPFKPLHYESTTFAKLPLSTGTGYYDRNSYQTRAFAKLTRPDLYKEKPTSKGYYFNATYTNQRLIIHNFKHYRLPVLVNKETVSPPDLILATFYAQRPTMMFTRNHISKPPKLKQRPVYNVDPLFLRMETMLTFPLMVQTRTVDSCLMYSFETIRGGCHYLDNIAKDYSSYFTIDWSSFDQSAPRVITKIYYTDFLESLIIINKGYQQTVDYPAPKVDSPSLFKKMTNLLDSLYQWYISMVFLTADGYGYQRTHAGVPSGLLNTQILDSFINLYLIIEAMLEYGFSPNEIREIKFFIMGDDNSGFTHLPVLELEKFITWFETYAKQRWNMTLSQTKSIITTLRNRIELLSYTCNFGYPKRPIEKLVAQLCYPERMMKPKYMSYRAIGIAYAAAGQDPTFHNFCQGIYALFFNEMAELDPMMKKTLWKHLPGTFRSLDPSEVDIDFTKFPTLYEVNEAYSKWRGSLKYEPKWDTSYFLSEPFCKEDNIETIQDYRIANNIERNKTQEYNINEYL